MIQTREKIATILSEATNPVVLLSGGKDSVLLLFLAREIRPDLGIIWWQTGSNAKFVKRLIVDWNLHVLSYAPSAQYMLGGQGRLSQVSEFAWGENRFPVVTDVIDGDKCSLLSYDKTPNAFHTFDCALVGWKATDRHWLIGDASFPPPDGVKLGMTSFFAPLRDWTDGQVWAATRALGLPYDKEVYDGGTDEISLCTKCYTSDAPVCYCPLKKTTVKVNSMNWDVKSFRQQFGVSI